MRAIIVSHTYSDPATRGKLRALASLGATLSVAVPNRWSPSARGPLFTTQWGTDGGVRIVPIPVSGPHRGDGGTWRASDLKRLISDFRPDLVQIEAEPWTPVAAIATRITSHLRIPSILFSWQSLPRPLSLGERWRRRRTVNRVQAYIGGNRLAAQLVSREHPDLPVAVIPQTGINPPLETQRPEHQALAVGFVGRLVPEKGLDSIFRACVKLHGRWSLTVVGSGPAQEQLEGLAERLGIAARVHWRGALPAEEVRALWPELDCLVVPSRTTAGWVETFHTPLIEAMGHGVTVITTDSGALPELVDTSGLVVPEDDVPALTAALQHLVDSPRERARLGREARQRVMAEFVDEAIARRTGEFWERVVGDKS